MKKVKIISILGIVYLLIVFGLTFTLNSCCGCKNKFYQVTYTNGIVEYYSYGNGDLNKNSDVFVDLVIRNEKGDKVSKKSVPQSTITSIQEIEGDMPKSTTAAVKPVPPIVKKDSLPNNIKLK